MSESDSLPNPNNNSPPKPFQDGQEESMPQLDTLISHLVAAKRSLSSINHVWRANEIVTAARSALEESVVVSARTGFLRRGLNNQLRLLYSVRTEVEEVSLRGRSEFATVLKSLDTADARLRKTSDLLRDTIVHASFRPEGEETKSLHDFVDERAIAELHTALKGSIDRTNAAQADLDTSNRAFDHELQSIKEALSNYRAATQLASSRTSVSPPSLSSSAASLPSLSSIPSMLHSLEMHAQELANLLESLVRHFDLCVTAVKHTEGGGAAARSITGDVPAAVHANGRVGSNIEEGINANLNAPLDPLSNSEYQEMVNVLIKDAAEADDVVMEIQDRIGEMEAVLENVLAQRDNTLSVYNATTGVFQHLSSLDATRLPGYIAQAHTFYRVWYEEHEKIQTGLNNLSDLCTFYDGFLDAYDGLILEVARRRHVRQRVEKVLRDAKHKLDQLYEEDVNAREAFRVEQGEYLPSDIWPGIGREPMRVEFHRISGGNLKSIAAGNPEPDSTAVESEEGAQDFPPDHGVEHDEIIPELPKALIDEAITRVNGRMRDLT
ncbi:autophagy-related protein 17 [Aspergillus avenaceus]|uniref:Autophagy-related protein 17 n=1 Tax=Aspergillus avenaceus TaxID=36643 RepID=A0A5N6U558_ASPAV|nr:autophagy-related protein 17 [Aspergillus avenaceus]